MARRYSYATRNVVVVIDWDDTKLWDEGHLVSNWARRMSESLTRSTKAEAPVNKRRAQSSGVTIVRGIDARKSRSKARGININLNSRAPHSLYVIHGTGTITAKSKKGMKLPAGRVGPGVNSATSKWVGFSFAPSKKRYKSVSGQPPNDYMTRGIDRASVTHPCLRG